MSPNRKIKINIFIGNKSSSRKCRMASSALARPVLYRASTASSMVPVASRTEQKQQQSLPVQPAQPVQPAMPVVRPPSTGAGDILGAKHERKYPQGELPAASRYRMEKRQRHAKERRSHMAKQSAGKPAVMKYTGITRLLPHIRPAITELCRVTRTYRSTIFPVNNVNGQTYTGAGFSFQGTYDGVGDTINPLIMAGGPASGVNTQVVFQNLSAEFAWFANVFRYSRIKKLEMHVMRMPAAVMQFVGPNGAGGVQQLGNPGNFLDPGIIGLFPWSGQPGIVNYTDGTLSAVDWDDWNRTEPKVVTPATSKFGNTQQTVMCVPPVSIVAIPDQARDSGDFIIEYLPTQTVDISDFRTGETNFNSFGHVLYWYYPMNSGAASNQAKLACWWEVEFDYWGLQRITGVPLEEDDPAYSDGVNAQLAAVGLQKDNIEFKHRPVKQVQQSEKVLTGNGVEDAVAVAIRQKHEEEERLKSEVRTLVEDYVEVTKK